MDTSSTASSSTVRPVSRRRDCLVSLGVGLVAFLIAANGNSWLFSRQVSLGVFATIVLSAALAAAIAAGLLPLNKLPRETALPLAGKTGGRAGLMTAFLSAGLLIMGVHLAGSGNPLYVWLPALLSILPGALAGIFAAALVASSTEENPQITLNTTLHETPGGSGWTVGVYALGIFGFVSPLFLPYHITKPAPPEEAPPPAVTAVATPVSSPSEPPPSTPPPPSKPSVPPPPPFQFKPDAALAKARPECWELATVKTLDSLDPAGSYPVAMSPDGQWLTGVAKGSEGKEMDLINLFDLQKVKTWRFSAGLSRVAFSSDGKWLAFLTAASPPEIHIAKEDRVLIELPLLEPLPAFDGGMEWPRENEIVFHRSGKPATVLNLETLLFNEDSGRTSTPKLSEGATWRFGFEPVSIKAQDPPPAGPVPRWNVTRNWRLSVAHPKENLFRLFPAIELHEKERLLATPDGNILIRFASTGVQACYFEPRQPPALDYQVTMPHEPEKFPEGSPLREADGRAALRVMIYAPLLNPLTKKCIGPDRRNIAGRARFMSWEGNKAILRLCEVLGQPAENYIFADPHLEKDSELELAELMTPHRWWTVVGIPIKDAQPVAEEDQPVSGSGLKLKYNCGAFLIESLPAAAGKSDAKVLLPSANAVSPSVAEPPPDIERVRLFVLEHHAKATRGDWAAEVDDYAFSVNYFDRGMISREMVAKDQEAYHARYDTKETVVEPIAIQQVTPDTFDVKYTLISEITEAGKPPRTVRSNVFLLVVKVQRRFMIMAHNPKR